MHCVTMLMLAALMLLAGAGPLPAADHDPVLSLGPGPDGSDVCKLTSLYWTVTRDINRYDPESANAPFQEAIYAQTTAAWLNLETLLGTSNFRLADNVYLDGYPRRSPPHFRGGMYTLFNYSFTRRFTAYTAKGNPYLTQGLQSHEVFIEKMDGHPGGEYKPRVNFGNYVVNHWEWYQTNRDRYVPPELKFWTVPNDDPSRDPVAHRITLPVIPILEAYPVLQECSREYNVLPRLAD